MQCSVMKCAEMLCTQTLTHTNIRPGTHVSRDRPFCLNVCFCCAGLCYLMLCYFMLCMCYSGALTCQCSQGRQFRVIPPPDCIDGCWFREVIGASQQTKVNGRSPKSLGSFPLLSAYVLLLQGCHPRLSANQVNGRSRGRVQGRSPSSQHTSNDGLGKSSGPLVMKNVCFAKAKAPFLENMHI